MGKRRMAMIKRIFTICIGIGILGSILFYTVSTVPANKIAKTFGGAAFPNGKIVFQHNYFLTKDTRRGEIRVFDFTALSAKTVVSCDDWCYAPRWSPDDKYFASTHKAPVGLNIKYAFNMKDYIYIHNIEIGKGINLIEGENPDWIE